MRNGVRRPVGALALLAACLQLGPALAQSKPSEIKIAVVQFLSGAAAPHDARLRPRVGAIAEFGAV